jgi:hypothetical protein
VFINDRLLAPNLPATREAAKPDLQAFLAKLFRGSEFSLSHGSDPRGLFGVNVKASREFSLADLLANLSS